MENKKIISIMGPSGVGKTTLGDNLSLRDGLYIPRHCTTRLRRSDDKDNFYRYLTHEEYEKEFLDGNFLITSGDGPTIKKEYGNFYGVLSSDCLEGWKHSDSIILFVSYKDIGRLIELREKGFNIDIINLTFYDIASGVRSRITNDSRRRTTQKEIESRIYWALKDDQDYRDIVMKEATTTIHTDVLAIEQTYEEACRVLKLRK